MTTLVAFKTLSDLRLAFPNLGYHFDETAFNALTHPSMILDFPNHEYDLGCGLFVHYFPNAQLRYVIVLK